MLIKLQIFRLYAVSCHVWFIPKGLLPISILSGVALLWWPGAWYLQYANVWPKLTPQLQHHLIFTRLKILFPPLSLFLPLALVWSFVVFPSAVSNFMVFIACLSCFTSCASSEIIFLTSFTTHTWLVNVLFAAVRFATVVQSDCVVLARPSNAAAVAENTWFVFWFTCPCLTLLAVL